MNGFTLTELLIAVACLLVLAAVFLPSLTKSKARSSKVGCNSNMKQVGMAFLSWSTDSQGRFPMQVPVASGGTMELVGNGTVFPHLLVMSNELSTPKILLCPNETTRTPATNFAVGFGDHNLSYFVGLGAINGAAASLLSGDRNLTNGQVPGSGVVKVTANLVLGWGKDMHSGKANVCFCDGSARQVQNGIVTAGTNRLAIP